MSDLRERVLKEVEEEENKEQIKKQSAVVNPGAIGLGEV